MDIPQETQSTVEECARRSHAGTLDFPSAVRKLIEAGVESYHADYRRAELTYYLPGGESHVATLHPPSLPVSDAFDAAGVHAAVLGAQQGVVHYPEFLARTMTSGCIGYVVWIGGRQVHYFGRRGEIHVEHFPPAPADLPPDRAD
jgi:uncharacterized protein YbcV (DUF1398 family)